MDILVKFKFVPVGNVLLVEGKLQFPRLADIPAIYKFQFDQEIYVGESDRIRGRFQQYRNPGSTQSTNIRMNALLIESLERNFEIQIELVEIAQINIDGVESKLDLSLKRCRLLLENAVLTKAHIEGQNVHNL